MRSIFKLIIKMQQINQFLGNLRKKYMNAVINATDPGYFLLKKKTAPLSPEQAEFVQIYENTFSLHTSSVLLSLPTSVYFYHYYVAKAKNDLNKLRWAKRGMLIFLPPAMAIVIAAWTYQKTHHFQDRLKQIQSFYLERKDQDINEISFTYPKAQAL